MDGKEFDEWGQSVQNLLQLKDHGSHFQLVGTSGSECGYVYCCTASATQVIYADVLCRRHPRQAVHVLVYLSSIKVWSLPRACDLIQFSTHLQSYFFNDDVFNFKYTQAKAATGNFQEAEEVGKPRGCSVLDM